MKKFLSVVLSLIFILSSLFVFTACDNGQSPSGVQDSTAVSDTTAPKDSTTVGEGEINFLFRVVDTEGKETYFNVFTDKATVGEALSENGIISGEESAYGLYVKTVNGTTLDYDKDGKYWAFYVGDELAPKGVDMTEIVSGTVYSFKAE